MPTATEISAAAQNFIDDTDTADAKINGAAGMVTDRHGVETKNLERIFMDLGYRPPVEYSAGLSVDGASYTVTYAGDTYAALPGASPFTTGTTFDASKWTLLGFNSSGYILETLDFLHRNTLSDADGAVATHHLPALPARSLYYNPLDASGRPRKVGLPTLRADLGFAYDPATGYFGVGLDANTPRTFLHVSENGGTPALPINALANLFVEDKVGSAVIQVSSPSAAGQASLFFGDSTSDGFVKVQAYVQSQSLNIEVGGTSVARYTTNGVGFGTITDPARPAHVSDALRLEPGPEPTAPSSGDLYMDSTTNKLRCYDGTIWHDLF